MSRETDKTKSVYLVVPLKMARRLSVYCALSLVKLKKSVVIRLTIPTLSVKWAVGLLGFQSHDVTLFESFVYRKIRVLSSTRQLK